jgi:hypothetical protein
MQILRGFPAPPARGIFAHADTIDSAQAPFLYQEAWSFFVLLLSKTVKLKGVIFIYFLISGTLSD